MLRTSFFYTALFILLTGTELRAQIKVPAAPASAKPPAEETPPILRLEAGGPTAQVAALAFSPDGKTLYAAGFDKVIRVWNLGPNGQFVPDPFAYRVPIGTGSVGVINAVAVSADGAWLAAGGLGATRIGSRPDAAGRVFPYLPSREASSSMLNERGTIFLFDTKSHAMRLLRGHTGPIPAMGLTFAPPLAGKPSLLVSAAVESGEQAGSTVGTVALWDPAKAAFLDDQGAFHEDATALIAKQVLVQSPSPLMCLAVLATGAQSGPIRVAVAWNDGKLRLWTPQQGKVEEPVGKPGKSSHSVAALGGTTFVTGGASLQDGGWLGHLNLWSDQAAGRSELVSHIPLPAPGDFEYVIPRALSALSSRGDGRLDLVASILEVRRRESNQVRFWLRLATVNDISKYLEVHDLWRSSQDSFSLPVMASSPRGQYLALAGNPKNEIWVYDIPTLRREGAIPQRLRSVGKTISEVAFARKGKADVGLILRGSSNGEPSRPLGTGPGDLVFDFSGRSLASDPRAHGWETTSPAKAGWQIVKVAPQGKSGNKVPWLVDWKAPEQLPGGELQVDLAPRELITASVLAPPLPDSANVPIIALATWNPSTSEALLRLFNGKRNQEVRRLAGHTRPIRSLAASANGKLLASAAEDQLVCLWSLATLDKVVEQSGGLGNLFVEKRQGNLVVARVDNDSLARGKLEAGDQIDSLMIGADGKPLPQKDPQGFYNAIFNLKPGSPITLNIQRRGVAQRVDLVVGQGIDEQRPLLSLFIASEKPDRHEWVAWSPLGPYDASSKAVERFVGWHFNGARLEEAPKFATVETYREKYYKPDLLKELVASADIHKALDAINRPAPIPSPALDVDVETVGQGTVREDERGQILVRSPDVTLGLTITGPALGKDQVEMITWRLNDEKPRNIELKKAVGQKLSEAIHLADGRGIYKIQVQLRTKEVNRQEASRQITLRFQPPPPEIEPGDLRRVQREAKFTINARVRPGGSGERIRVNLVKNKSKPIPLNLAGDQLTQTEDLKPGENVLELRAQNENALAGFEAFETTVRSLVIVFQPQAAPQISFKDLKPVVSFRAEPIAIVPGQPLVVRYSRVKINGLVKATEDLLPVEIRGRDKRLLATLTGGTKEVSLGQQEIGLEPGDQELRFIAKTANTGPTEASLKISYRPALPELTVTEPRDNLVLQEKDASPELEVKGEIVPPDEFQPFQIEIQVTNKNQIVKQEGKDQIVVPFVANPFAANKENLSLNLAKIRLGPGENQIQVQLRSQWETSPPIRKTVSYRRPPEIVEFKPPKTGATPFVTVEAKVATPAELELTGVFLAGVFSNERPYEPSVARKVATEKDRTTWSIRIPEVPLQQGSNIIRLAVANADGRCLKEGEVTVEFNQATKERAKIYPEVPQEPVGNARFPLEFRVRSFTKIKRVELHRAEKGQDQTPEVIDVTNQQSVLGFWELNVTHVLQLKPEMNHYRIVAINEGGEAESPVAINFQEPPVSLVVDEPPKEVKTAKYPLRGYVAFRNPQEAAEKEAKARSIRVFVNGFLQRPAAIQPRSAQAARANFSVDLLFNQPENQVVVECPDLDLEAGLQQTFSVKCASPQKPGTLHLLVVGVDVRDAKQKNDLIKQAFDALQAQEGDKVIHSPVFNRVIMHPCDHLDAAQQHKILADFVEPGQVRNGLKTIEKFIRDFGSPSDVVLIYWLGKEAVREGDEWYLPTSRKRRPGEKWSQTAVPLKSLTAQDGMPGARVVLLDLASRPALEPAPVLDFAGARAAVLQYEWSKSDTPPLPGLLKALEEAATGDKPISLLDVAHEAERFRVQRPEKPRLTHNLETVSSLATLIVSKKP
jgi:WD40 repeat protein